MPERVREHAQRAQRRVHGVQVFDLVVEVALGRGIEFAGAAALKQDFDEQSAGNRDSPLSVAAKMD